MGFVGWEIHKQRCGAGEEQGAWEGRLARWHWDRTEEECGLSGEASRELKRNLLGLEAIPRL